MGNESRVEGSVLGRESATLTSLLTSKFLLTGRVGEDSNLDLLFFSRRGSLRAVTDMVSLTPLSVPPHPLAKHSSQTKPAGCCSHSLLSPARAGAWQPSKMTHFLQTQTKKLHLGPRKVSLIRPSVSRVAQTPLSYPSSLPSLPAASH